jgi:hypothetical protein
MKTCVPCKRTFMSWRQFSKHMADVHQVNPVVLARRAAQCPDGDLYAVGTDSGRMLLMSQPELL